MTKHKLIKNLGALDVFCISSGAMISSGIFILPGLAFREVGPGVFVSYLIAGIFALLGTLAVIELSTAMPKAGGSYYYIERSLGPLAGTISGFLSWFALSLKTSFAIFGLAEVARVMFGWNLTLCAIIAAILFVGINIVGTKEAAWLEIVMVAALMVILGGYVIFLMPKVSVLQFEPFVNEGQSGAALFSVAAFVFVSFGGLLNVSSISEEVKKPRRNIPLGMIASVFVVTLLYTLILMVTVGIMPAEKLTGSMTPLADAARIYHGNFGYYVVTVGALLAFITTANAGIMASSRFPLALSRDELLPRFMSTVNGRLKTPLNAILVTGTFIILSLLLKIDTLVKAASTVILLSYVLTNLAVIILRESRIQNYRPSFKMPLYPFLPFLNLGVFIFMIVKMGMEAVEISLIIIGLALIIYVFFGRKVSREFALLHLVGRMKNKRLDTHGLEGELREIIRQRDELVKDDFDMLVEMAPVFTYEEAMTSDDLFKKIAEDIGPMFDMDPVKMHGLIKERELESSTAITPTVAIPHIILEGENRFKLFIVKCIKGADFGGNNSNVGAIFVLIGTRDQRNRHLKALAAIAQIIQNQRFDAAWMAARTEKQVRDLLLLGKRKREV
ncbi:MAG: amino acid permease [Lentisphaerae bacterium]|nr:amino acid permease [Lentisphaerota bacterium]MCP4103149.1 amino acid permease [Lentisphaerota bacterium]